MPVSSIFFGLAILVFLAQLVPMLGVALMMFAAAYWSVVLVNLGFAGIAVETLQKRVALGWIALPILWFGGYAVVAAFSNVSAHLTDLNVRHENAGKRLTFASSSQSIIIKPQTRDGSHFDDSELARQMTLLYGTGPVFVENSNVGPGYVAWGREDEPPGRCATAIQRLSIDCPSHKPFGRAYDTPLRPWRPRIVVQVGVVAGSYGAHRISVPIHVEDAAGQSVDLIAGAVQPLSWWPQPIAGCGLNGSEARWQCFAAFGRGKWRGLGAEYINGPPVAGVLAEALGLAELQNP